MYCVTGAHNGNLSLMMKLKEMALIGLFGNDKGLKKIGESPMNKETSQYSHRANKQTNELPKTLN